MAQGALAAISCCNSALAPGISTASLPYFLGSSASICLTSATAKDRLSQPARQQGGGQEKRNSRGTGIEDKTLTIVPAFGSLASARVAIYSWLTFQCCLLRGEQLQHVYLHSSRVSVGMTYTSAAVRSLQDDFGVYPNLITDPVVTTAQQGSGDSLGQGSESSRMPVPDDGGGRIDYGSIHIEQEAVECDAFRGRGVLHPCRPT
ncbi:hypothetical protein NUW58_g10587 [Xylaria curta]|uniref:Uncharacterized protein n=1 Tax=Xylaria curta TaxID=42375 RepID=A0ACC1MIC6_9PEZI|nr:hypothetical protein NUW58_g10587 [Xylaria curta]